MIEWSAFGLRLAEPVLRLVGGPLYGRYLKYKARRDIRRGPGKKIHILIARLAEDTATNSFRETLYETIRRELGDAVELTTWPDVQILGDGNQYLMSERRAYEKAQKLLKERHCDLLISGRVKGRSTNTTVLSLRFTVPEARAKNHESYKLTETFDLPADFVGDLGAAISARAVMSAAPAVEMPGHYLVPLMQVAAEQLEPMVQHLSPKIRPQHTRLAAFQYSSPLCNTRIGEQSGSNEALRRAIHASRRALLEYTRERVPLQWATTQNNLGNALRTLGERESGTARLEEAVAAYRAALEERTRERVPLDWAMTQNNLGNALQTLGERESGTARLEEAVAAYRAALEE